MRFLVLLASRWSLLGGLYLGWGLGANDSAKIFAPALATNSIRYRTAIMVIVVFVILGATTHGTALYDGYRFSAAEVRPETLLREAGIATTAAAVAVMISTFLALPVSTSQAAVGALVGVAAAGSGRGAIDTGLLMKMLLCWIITPPAAALISYAFHRVGERPLRRFVPSPQRRNRALQIFLILFGCYEAYALGANNVVVTTGPFYQAGIFRTSLPLLSKIDARVLAAFVGGLSIAFGAVTYGHKVMETMAKKIVVLDPYAAAIVAVATGTTLECFTLMKVPVSITQAGVGALIGVGLTKGSAGVSLPMLKRIGAAWVISPLLAGGLAWMTGRLLG
jgi:PiT family inorganic phosphate transporter